MEILNETIEIAHYNVSPYAMALMLIFAVTLNNITAYGFLLSFLTWILCITSRLFQLLWRYGLLGLLKRMTLSYSEYVIEQLSRMKDLYIFKVTSSILLAFLVCSVALYVKNLDVIRMLEITFNFLTDLPVILFDQAKLIFSIQTWINKMYLGYIIYPMAATWEFQKSLIENSPVLGFFSISLIPIALSLIFLIASLLRQVQVGNFSGLAAKFWKDLNLDGDKFLILCSMIFGWTVLVVFSVRIFIPHLACENLCQVEK